MILLALAFRGEGSESGDIALTVLGARIGPRLIYAGPSLVFTESEYDELFGGTKNCRSWPKKKGSARKKHCRLGGRW